MADEKADEKERSPSPADPAGGAAAGSEASPGGAQEAPFDGGSDGGGSGDPAGRLQEVTQQLAAAEEKLDSYRDQALRAQAEAENTRRRASRDVENAHKYALEKFTADLLPVLDSLEKAVEVASDAQGAQPIAEGVELSLKLFLSVLEKHGVERIDPAGEPFDPQVHEAMTMVPSHHAEPNSVLEVMQRGYLLNGRLVRAAKVVVARAPDDASRNGS